MSYAHAQFATSSPSKLALASIFPLLLSDIKTKALQTCQIPIYIFLQVYYYGNLVPA